MGPLADVLHEHPKVREAVVVGVPHRVRGEQLVAKVVLKDGATDYEREIRRESRIGLKTHGTPVSPSTDSEMHGIHYRRSGRRDGQESAVARISELKGIPMRVKNRVKDLLVITASPSSHRSGGLHGIRRRRTDRTLQS